MNKSYYIDNFSPKNSYNDEYQNFICNANTIIFYKFLFSEKFT